MADTVLFKHKYITWPAITHGDVVVKAALDLARALRGKTVVKSKEQMRDLTQLSEIFSQLAKADPDAASKQVATDHSPCPIPSQLAPPAQRVGLPGMMGVPAGPTPVGLALHRNPSQLIVESSTAEPAAEPAAV